MNLNSTDLANLKEAIQDLKRTVKTSIEITKENKLALDMNNLLMLVNLGILAQEDLIETEIYTNYINKNIFKQKKKSLF